MANVMITSAFWTLFMGVLCLVFTIGALRINVVLVFLLFTLTMAFTFFTGAYWSLAKGNVLVAERLVVVSGHQSGALFPHHLIIAPS